MAIISLVLNVVLIVACSASLLAVTNIRSRPAYLLGLYVLSYADVVIILEGAGLLSAISASVVFALQLSVTTLSMLVWLRAGKPSLFGPFSGLKFQRLPFARLLSAARKSQWLAILTALLIAGVVYTYTRHAQLILLVPPDNMDSLTYHLSRVGYWLQYKSFYPWPTPTFGQVGWPMNAELGLLWTILWWGTDQLTGFVQWATIPAIMIGIYGLTRFLRYSRWQAVVVALLWATLTQVLIQSSTTQNDLVTASFWVGTVYFFSAGLRTRNSTHFILSGIAFGLAMGTKSTSLIAVPGLVIAVAVVILLCHRQKGFKTSLFRWTVACLLGFLFLGSYTYLQDNIVFGNPLGPVSFQKSILGLPAKPLIAAYAQRVRDNLGRFTYQLVDFSPLPFDLASRINPVKAAFFAPIFQVLGISTQNPETTEYGAGFDLQYVNGLDQDASWFGPLATFLMVAVVYQGYRAVRRGDALRFILVLTPMAFLVVHSAALGWSPFGGRYYNTPIAVSFPLMACFLQPRTSWRVGLTSVLIFLGLITMSTVELSNSRLQRIGWRNPLTDTRIAPSWLSKFNNRMIAENVPANASIGIDSEAEFADYPFFGEHFTRRVTLAIPADETILPRVDTGRFVADFQDSDFLFLVGGQSRFVANLAPGRFRLLSAYDGDSLWIRKDLHPSNACDGDKWPFADFFHSSTAAVCPQFPIIPSSVAHGYVQSTFLKTGQLLSIIGIGSDGRLEFGLLVTEDSNVRFSIQVKPRNGTATQTLLLVISGTESQPNSFSATFGKEESLDFTIALQSGVYRLQLGLTDGEQAAISGFRVTVP